MKNSNSIYANEDLVFASKMALQVFQDYWGSEDGHGNQQIGEAWQAPAAAIDKAESSQPKSTKAKPSLWVIVNNAGKQNEYVVMECNSQNEAYKFMKRDASWQLMKRLSNGQLTTEF
jgi:hypothetical protein